MKKSKQNVLQRRWRGDPYQFVANGNGNALFIVEVHVAIKQVNRHSTFFNNLKETIFQLNRNMIKNQIKNLFTIARGVESGITGNKSSPEVRTGFESARKPKPLTTGPRLLQLPNFRIATLWTTKYRFYCFCFCRQHGTIVSTSCKSDAV